MVFLGDVVVDDDDDDDDDDDADGHRVNEGQQSSLSSGRCKARINAHHPTTRLAGLGQEDVRGS